MSLSLRGRLAGLSALLFGILLGALSLVSYRVLARGLSADVTARLAELTEGLHGYLRFGGGPPALAYDAGDNHQSAFVREATRYYRLTDAATGKVLVQSPGLARLGWQPARPLPRVPGTIRYEDSLTPEGRIRFSSSLIQDAGRSYLLQVGLPLASMDATLLRYRSLLLRAAIPALLVALAASWWLSGLALRPLSRVAAAARAIDVTTLDRRLPVRDVGDELDEVARAFNDTLTRLQESFAEIRQFSAALAHELRTPMAALRGEIELSLRAARGSDLAPALASQIEEIDRLKRLIDHILTLVRVESGQVALTFTPVDLGELARALTAQLEVLADARSIALTCEGLPHLVVEADAGWLERLVLNLIDNALKFTPEGGRVRLRLAREGTVARLDVHDTGIGMTPEVAARVFDRFYRGDPARPAGADGAGLGLTLVKWIVERHAGSIAVQTQPGRGTTFTVRLPLRRSHVRAA